MSSGPRGFCISPEAESSGVAVARAGGRLSGILTVGAAKSIALVGSAAEESKPQAITSNKMIPKVASRIGCNRVLRLGKVIGSN